MYKIYANGEIIHHPNLFDEGYLLVEPKIEKDSLYSQGSFSFTMPPNHPYYDNIEPLNTIITVWDDTEELFRGRVLNTTRDFYNQKEVYCEGELAFLLDSYYRPFGYSGGVEDFFTAIIENHNSQVDETRQFAVGEVTVTDTNDYIVRSSETALTSWEMINDKLIDLLGGYIRIRVENNVRYIDYIADYEEYNDQTIKFGENLLDIENYTSAEDIITCLIPYGAEYDDDDENYTEQPENGSYNGNRLTIESVTDDGRDYVYSETGVALYGQIWGTNTWDDVTVADNLLTKAQAYVEAGVAAATTMTIKAVDLHLVDVDATRIHMGDYVQVYSTPHNLNIWLQCTAMSVDLQNPENTEITLGAGSATLTGITASGSSSGGASSSSTLGDTIISGDLSVSGTTRLGNIGSNLYLSNAKSIYFADSDGTDAATIGMTSENNFFAGNYSYDTYVRGKTLNIGNFGYPTYFWGSTMDVYGNLNVTDIAGTNEMQVNVSNTIASGRLVVSNSGNFGLYSSTFSAWLARTDIYGANYIGNSSYKTYVQGSTIYHNGTAYSSSDRRRKTDIVPIPDGYKDKLDTIEPVRYKFKGENRDRLGYIAQDIEAAGLTELISKSDDGMMYLDYNQIIPLLHQKIKSLEARIQALEEKEDE